MGKFVILKTFNTRVEAEEVKAFLQANGIEAAIEADDLGGTHPFPMQPSGARGVKLLVSETQFKQAQELITEDPS